MPSRQDSRQLVDKPKQEWLRRMIINSTVSSSEEDEVEPEPPAAVKPASPQKRPAVLKAVPKKEPSKRASEKASISKKRGSSSKEHDRRGRDSDRSAKRSRKSSVKEGHSLPLKPAGCIYVSYYVCPIAGCSECYGSVDHLGCHIRAVHQNRASFRCLNCAAKFDFEVELDRHERRPCYPSDAKIDAKKSAKKERIYSCSKCPKTFNDKSLYDDHYAGVHLRKPQHKCNMCKQRFVMYCELRQHERRTGHGPLCLTADQVTDSQKNQPSVSSDVSVTQRVDDARTSGQSESNKRIKSEPPVDANNFNYYISGASMQSLPLIYQTTVPLTWSQNAAHNFLPVILARVKQEPVDLEEGELREEPAAAAPVFCLTCRHCLSQ